MLLAKSRAYQDAADAPATIKAYEADYKAFAAWCQQHGFTAMPPAPAIVGAYLAAAGDGYAIPTLRRRVAAIARAAGIARHPLDTRHPGNLARHPAQTHATRPPGRRVDHGRNQTLLRGLRHHTHGPSRSRPAPACLRRSPPPVRTGRA